MVLEAVWPALRAGERCAREGWSGKGQWVQVVLPQSQGAGNAGGAGEPNMTLPFVAVFTCKGHWVPWVASQKDLLDDDWFILSDVPRGTLEGGQ